MAAFRWSQFSSFIIKIEKIYSTPAAWSYRKLPILIFCFILFHKKIWFFQKKTHIFVPIFTKIHLETSVVAGLVMTDEAKIDDK